jgi:hypothetical protein
MGVRQRTTPEIKSGYEDETEHATIDKIELSADRQCDRDKVEMRHA